jgi:hypothetical protein
MPCFAGALLAAALVEPPPPCMAPLATHDSGRFKQSASEIAARSPKGDALLVIDAVQGLVELAMSPDGTLTQRSIVSLPRANSVAVYADLVAVACAAPLPGDAGVVHLFDRDLQPIATVAVGVGPDMVTFTPDGRSILVANEGEPSADGLIDAPGSVSIIDVSAGARIATVKTVGFHAFDPQAESLMKRGVHLALRHAPLSVQAEPEYIACSPDGKLAFIGLQEIAAVAVLDVAAAQITALIPLGTKDFSLPGAGIDPSDRDGGIRIAPHPVRGLLQPDAMACFEHGGALWLVTANEGEEREQGSFKEGVRWGDATRSPSAPRTKDLDRLSVSRVASDPDGDGTLDQPVTFGGRSMSLWRFVPAAGEAPPRLELAWDSGDAFERLVAERHPASFNADLDATPWADGRSDAKGPEPEGLALGVIGERRLAFVGLERSHGLIVIDLTDPTAPRTIDHVTRCDPSVDLAIAAKDAAVLKAVGDLAPEGVLFIPADCNPTKRPLVVTCNEVSGTTTVWAVGTAK